MSNQLTKEPRTVSGVVIRGHVAYYVGSDGVTAIEPFDEPGQMAYVAWFNVWRETELFAKVNAACVAVVGYRP